MASRYDIAVEALHKLSWLVPNFNDCVLLVPGDFLSPEVELSIDVPKLSVIFMSNKLLPKRLHQVLVELILDRCPALCRIMKCQQMPLNFRGKFKEPVEVTLQCSWSATPDVCYVYNKLIQ